MPKYTVRLSDGRTVTVQADQPPTEAQILAQIGPPKSERALIDINTDDLSSMKDTVASALPTIGGMAGSFLGRKKGGPVGQVVGAGAGGALGKGAEMLVDDVDQGVGEGLREMGGAALQQGGTEAVGVLGGMGLGALGKSVYKGAVGLLPKTLKQSNPNIAETGIREGIALTKRGAEKAENLVGLSRRQADDMIATAHQAGAPPVRPMEVLRELRPVGQRMRNQAALGKPDAMPGLVERSKAFLGGGDIPLQQAQTLKREAQGLAKSAYKARDKGAVINEMEALTDEAQAKGLRQAIERRVPGVGDVNKRTQDLAGLQEGAEHASGTGHIIPRVLGGIGVGSLLGSGGGALPALGMAALGSTLTTPQGLSRLGLGLNRTGRIAEPHAAQAARAAILMQLLGQSEQ